MDPLTLQAAMHKRGGEAGMLFRDEPRAKLGAFNTWMSADAISHVIERLEVSLCERAFAAVAAG